MIKATIIGFTCFILFLLIHIIVFRAVDMKERFKAMTAIFYSLIPVYAAAYYLIPTGYTVVEDFGAAGVALSALFTHRLTLILYFLSGLMLYIFLFLGYCQFYFIVDRSISVRVMIEIENSPNKRLNFDEIQGRYSFYEIFTRRLGHMIEGRYLVNESGYYSNTKKGRAEAVLFRSIKDLLRLGKGG